MKFTLVLITFLLARLGTTMSTRSSVECRKAGVAVVFPSLDDKTRSYIRNLIVWSGKGNHRELIFEDANSFDLDARRWSGPLQQHGTHDNYYSTRDKYIPKSQSKTVISYFPGSISTQDREGKSSIAVRIPPSRWKTFAAYNKNLHGILVWGGSTRPHAYFNDLWLMKPVGTKEHGIKQLGWQPAEYIGQDNNTLFLPIKDTHVSSSSIPVARRAFGGALLPPCRENGKDGTLAIALGRDEGGTLLEDIWLGDLSWPHVRWNKVWDANTSAESTKPPPRRGNVLMYVDNDKSDPVLVVLGGRTFNWEGYLSDIWAFHLNTRKWEEWTPKRGWFRKPPLAPVGRDHFQAIVHGKFIYIFGGRGGATYNKSLPLGDIWKFDTERRQWKEITPLTGPSPRPRFLSMLSSYCSQPRGCTDGDDRVIIFGGETQGPAVKYSGIDDADNDDGDDGNGHAGSFNGCYLNDIWEFRIPEHTWTEISPPRWCSNRCKQLDATKRVSVARNRKFGGNFLFTLM